MGRLTLACFLFLVFYLSRRAYNVQGVINIFVVLNVKDGSFLKRRKLYKHPEMMEIHVQGGLSFFSIDTAIYKKKLNISLLKELCGELYSRILFPDNMMSSAELKKIDVSDFKKLLLFNTALYVIKKCIPNRKKLSLCIADRNGALADKMRLAVAEVSDVRIKTQRKDLYYEEISMAMDEFGARVRFCEKENADIVIDLDNEGLNGKAVFSETNICGENLGLPLCYSRLCPKDINPIEFACALYKFSRVSTMNCLKYRDLTLGSKPCSLSDLRGFLQSVLY